MLERIVAAHVKSSHNEGQRYSVETVALILEILDSQYGNARQSIEPQMSRNKIVSCCKELTKEYLSLLQKKGFIRYYEVHRLYIPTDKGMHFLKMYRMLASLLI